MKSFRLSGFAMFVGFAVLLLIGALSVPVGASTPGDASEARADHAAAVAIDATEVRQVDDAAPSPCACRITCECGPACPCGACQGIEPNEAGDARHSLWKIDKQGETIAKLTTVSSPADVRGEPNASRVAELR